MQITSILVDYIKAEKTDYAIMINGEWGTGKSWYWNNVLTNEIEKIETPDSAPGAPKRYKTVTISLFGISSPEELRSRIFEETNVFFKNKYVKTGAKLIGFGANKIASFFNVSEIQRGDVADIFSELSINLDNYVLCFDDLERVTSSVLLELLGYINTLIEQDNTKVVFICNESELNNEDYRKYKEKIVRFTHTVQAEVNEMVIRFAENRQNEEYKKFLYKQSSYIASVYKKGNCNNLRTLKFNIDIFEKVFDLVCTTIRSSEVSRVESVNNYMLLLSMMYSIEFRRDNDEKRLLSLSSITPSWSYQIDIIDSLERHDDRTESETTMKNVDPILEYQQQTRRRYFRNTYIYGSSLALIKYLLTGYLDEETVRREILAIDYESQKYVTSEEKQLFWSLSQFWDTNDDEMQRAVNRTLERVREASFILVDYPTFFLCLQRLQLYEFIDLKMSIPELLNMFADAIDRCNTPTYIEDINGCYHNNQAISTPEYEELVGKVKKINADTFSSISLNNFERIIRDVKGIEQLNSYQGLIINLFQNIPAEEFFRLFLQYNNSRKRDIWNFFDERYSFRDCYFADRDFIFSLKEILHNYVKNPDTPISGTRKYCFKLLEQISKKVLLYEPGFENNQGE